MSEYRELYRNFRWEIPEYFNFGAVIDGLGAEPGLPAVVAEDQDGNRARLCFSDLRQQSNRIANVLVGLGVKPGEAVIIALPRISLWQSAYVGALKAGAIVVPCAATMSERELAYRANHCGAVAIIAAIGSAEVVGDLRNQCPSLRQYIIAGSTRSGWLGLRASMAEASEHFSSVRTRAGDPALCLYTSGTEREPMAVLHSHAHVWSHRYTGSLWLDTRLGELHWGTADTGWAKAGYAALFGPWMNGATIFMYNGVLDAKKQADLLSRYPIATFCARPTEYRLLAETDLKDRRFAALRHCTSTGEMLDAQTLGAWRDRFGLTIHDGYGQTETTLIAANLPGMEVKAGSMGLPFPGHDVRILANDDNESGEGEVGRIAIRIKPDRPPSLLLEYWKDKEASAAVIRGDYFVTGDLGSRDAEGYLWYAGRDDDLIVAGGYRMSPLEIERSLATHRAVSESAAIASPDKRVGTIVKAFVKLKPGIEPSFATARELQEHVRRVGAMHKVPREIEFVAELPKTDSGKIRRAELRKTERTRADSV